MTVGNIKVAGKTENNTEKVNFSTLHQVSGEREFGMMAKESDGTQLIHLNNFF
jgi:hypothetical protein